MRKDSKIIIVIAIVILGLVGLISWHRTQAAKKYIHSSTPTIFVHGWGSSYHAETKMTHAAWRAGATNTIVRANVDRHGHVRFNREIPARAVNPIVEVNLADNKLSAYGASNNYVQGYRHGGTYICNVVHALERQHHYKAINLVGHSMGNLEIINYINDNINNRQLPQIKHLVAIAGHYNGLVGQPKAEKTTVNSQGKPSWMDPTYKALLGLRKNFPRNTSVLNIYGDLDNGSRSDKDVPVNSARSLKYLVAGRAKSYREVEIHGRNAQHSKLHDNPQVNRELIRFLWAK